MDRGKKTQMIDNKYLQQLFLHGGIMGNYIFFLSISLYHLKLISMHYFYYKKISTIKRDEGNKYGHRERRWPHTNSPVLGGPNICSNLLEIIYPTYVFITLITYPQHASPLLLRGKNWILVGILLTYIFFFFFCCQYLHAKHIFKTTCISVVYLLKLMNQY